MRLRNAFTNSVYEASKLVSTKTLLLKHYYGCFQNENSESECEEQILGELFRHMRIGELGTMNAFMRKSFSPTMNLNTKAEATKDFGDLISH